MKVQHSRLVLKIVDLATLLERDETIEQNRKVKVGLGHREIILTIQVARELLRHILQFSTKKESNKQYKIFNNSVKSNSIKQIQNVAKKNHRKTVRKRGKFPRQSRI